MIPNVISFQFLFKLLWPVFAIGGVLVALKIFLYLIYPSLKGKIGEWYVKQGLSFLNKDSYRVLNNLLLPSTGRTKTTQIDHIVISQYGIFCIETKNCNGSIFGNADDDFLTQVLYRCKHKLYNPFKQSYAHTKAVEAIVGTQYARIPIVPLVVFLSASRLNIAGTNAVIFGNELIQTIKQHSEPNLTPEQQNGIYQKLLSANITDPQKRKEHIREVRAQNILK